MKQLQIAPYTAGAASAYAMALAMLLGESFAAAQGAPPRADAASSVKTPALQPLTVRGHGSAPASSSTVTTHQPSDPADAARNLEGCKRGDKVACHAAALDAYYEPSSPTTDREAFERFKKACDAGYAASCNGLGLLFSQGRGVAQDSVRAAQLYRAACIAGSSTGCEHLDSALRSGRGVAKDEAAAGRAQARAKCVFTAMLAKRGIESCPALD